MTTKPQYLYAYKDENATPNTVYTDSTELTTGMTLYDNTGEATNLIISTINQDGSFDVAETVNIYVNFAHQLDSIYAGMDIEAAGADGSQTGEYFTHLDSIPELNTNVLVLTAPKGMVLTFNIASAYHFGKPKVLENTSTQAITYVESNYTEAGQYDDYYNSPMGTFSNKSPWLLTNDIIIRDEHSGSGSGGTN